MKKSKNYTLTILKNGRDIDTVRTHSLRLFLTRLRSTKWGKGVSTYLRVSYGKKLDHTGKMSTFFNDGNYDNQDDFLFAFKAFNDED